ncbi:glycosyltransferase [Paenibacillus daejeonensis]|uniref:glycosyltransferase n=1 Tax=Paenibacillus daejeonensis TaxID=135193 RepID=UPI000373E0A6|nr:glycosyltransferase [Paenibacillus daejeonensis]
MSTFSIVILAQHAELLDACLTALKQHTSKPTEWLIINDGNQEEITQVIARYTDPSIQVIATPSLVGVATGYNLGAAAAHGERIVFLRDHVTVSDGWLEALSHGLDEHPLAAVAGPLSHGISGPQQTEVPVKAILHLPADQRQAFLSRNGTVSRTWRLLSFLMMVRKESFHALGGFDERFVLESYEDDDFCLRALRGGYELCIAHNAVVTYTAPPSLFPENPSWFGERLATNRQAATDKWGGDVMTLLMQETRPVTVSLCLIVKNEEATLANCLSSVADLMDEIIIVDTGSTDRTKAIAAQFNARIFDFEWVHDFSMARNYAFQQATQEYILWLDADDIFLPEDRERLHELIHALPYPTDAVSMAYHLHHDSQGNVASSIRRNRLVRRSKGFQWIGWVHEYLEVHGSMLASDIAVTHNRVHEATTRNLDLYETRLRQGDRFGARDVYYYANELYDHGRWEEAAEQYEHLLTMSDVWIEDRIGACGKASECYIQLNRLDQARLKALQSFAYALPRAENCCRLGQSFLLEQRYSEAVHWYTAATQLTMPTDSQALLIHACWTWLPYLQLCVCYDRLGEYALAYEANEQAGTYLTDDRRITDNRAYLKQRLQSSGG